MSFEIIWFKSSDDIVSHLTTLIAMENYVNASYTKSRMLGGSAVQLEHGFHEAVLEKCQRKDGK